MRQCRRFYKLYNCHNRRIFSECSFAIYQMHIITRPETRNDLRKRRQCHFHRRLQTSLRVWKWFFLFFFFSYERARTRNCKKLRHYGNREMQMNPIFARGAVVEQLLTLHLHSPRLGNAPRVYFNTAQDRRFWRGLAVACKWVRRKQGMSSEDHFAVS